MSFIQGQTVHVLGEDLAWQAAERPSRGASGKCKFIEHQKTQRGMRCDGLAGWAFPCKASGSWFPGQGELAQAVVGIVTSVR